MASVVLGFIVPLTSCGVAGTADGAGSGATSPDPVQLAQILSARPVDGPALTVRYVVGNCEGIADARATEVGDAVRVVLSLRRNDASCADIGVIKETVIPLDHPLGDRPIIDATGSPVTRG